MLKLLELLKIRGSVPTLATLALEANMGGMGSGRRWYWGAKNSTDGDYRSIDVRL